MTQPALGQLLDQLRPYLAGMISTSFDEFKRKLPTTTYGPGTVVSTDANTGICQVIPDESTAGETIQAHSLTGIPAKSARVMLQFSPPSGVYIVGYLSSMRGCQPIGFSVRLNTPQTVATGGSGATLLWDTTVSDDYGFLSGGVATVPAALGGRYVISLTGQYDTAPTAGQNASLDIRVTTGAALTLFRGGCPPGEIVSSPCAAVTLYPGTQVILAAFHTTGAPRTVIASAELWRLGD